MITGDDVDSDEVTQDVHTSLRGLVLFCAKRNALIWRELWNEWRYSEVVDFAAALIDERRKEHDNLKAMDLEYAEQITAATMGMIADKI